MTDCRKCAVTMCPDPVRFVVRFRYSGKYEYCDKHGWRLARGEHALDAQTLSRRY